MNRLHHHSQRLNDLLFAVVLATAAASTGWLAAAGSEPAAVPLRAAVAIEHVGVAGQRERAVQPVAAPIELPRVVVTGKRIDEALARAASRDGNG